VTPRHPDTDRRRNAIIVATGGVLREGAPELGGTHRAILAANIADAVLALAGLRLPAEPEAPTPANDCAGYGFGICPCGCHDQPVPTPEPPAEPHYNAIHEDGTNGSIDRPASVPEAAPGLREALDEIESVLSDGWALRLTSRPTAGYRAEALYNDKVKVYVVAATPDGALRELSDVITESHVND
jgi:hypothetical protein